MGPGKPIKVRQTEEVAYKLDGLVLLIEGTGRDDSGNVVYAALGTVGFDPQTNSYRVRAYRDGNYIDTELKVDANAFEWGFDAGPVKVLNRMSLDADGRWKETTDAKLPDGREVRTVEMVLKRQ